MLINTTTNQYPVFEYSVRSKYPNVSFPEDPKLVDWSQFGYAYVYPTAQPTHNPKLQQVTEILPQADQTGRYTQTWQVTDLDPVAIQLLELKESEGLADRARVTRTRLLALSDWTQVADSPLSQETRAAWATYRQALRDISQQEGFPHTITWPTQPQ